MTVVLDVADLGVPRTLSQFAVQQSPDRWRLDRSLVVALAAETVLDTLGRRTALPVPEALAVRVRAWCGKLGQAGVARVKVVQVAAEHAAALAELPEVELHLRGVLPGGLLWVEDGHRRALVKALEALGVRVVEGLRSG